VGRVFTAESYSCLIVAALSIAGDRRKIVDACCTLCVHNGVVAAIVRPPVRATYSSIDPGGNGSLPAYAASDSCCCGCCGRKLIVKDVIVYFISRPRVVAAHTPDFKRPALFYIRLPGVGCSMNTFIVCGIGCRVPAATDLTFLNPERRMRYVSTPATLSCHCVDTLTLAVSLLSREKRRSRSRSASAVATAAGPRSRMTLRRHQKHALLSSHVCEHRSQEPSRDPLRTHARLQNTCGIRTPGCGVWTLLISEVRTHTHTYIHIHTHVVRCG
jgi:hypothetical protein